MQRRQCLLLFLGRIARIAQMRLVLQMPRVAWSVYLRVSWARA